MYRQTNDENSFQVRNTTDVGYLSHDKYPAQKEEYLGKYICLRYKSYISQEINNRFKVPTCKEYMFYAYPEKTGIQTFFEILRWDTEEPFRAILMSTRGEVICTYTKLLEEQLYDLVPSIIYNSTLEQAAEKNITYQTLNETDNKILFFNKLYNEKIHLYPEQDIRLLGVEVISEYDTDLSLPKNTEGVINKKNDHRFTAEMKAQMDKMDPLLYCMPEEIYRSYPHWYDVHEPSYIDNPIRAINHGYIIRADIQGSIEPELVVMEVLKNNTLRFVTQYEARFYYQTGTEKKVHDIHNALLDVYNFVKEKQG